MNLTNAKVDQTLNQEFQLDAQLAIDADGLDATDSTFFSIVAPDLIMGASFESAKFQNTVGLKLFLTPNSDEFAESLSFVNAKFGQAQNAELTVRMTGDWQGANLAGAQFTTFRISKNTTNYENVSDIDLAAVNFSNGVFPTDYEIQGADLSGANFSNATLATFPAGSCVGSCGGMATSNVCSCESSCLEEGNCCADICSACSDSIPEIQLPCQVEVKSIPVSGFHDVTLSETSFVGANLTAVDFSGDDLTGVLFDQANLNGVVWENAICPTGEAAPAGGTCCGTLLNGAIPDPLGGCPNYEGNVSLIGETPSDITYPGEELMQYSFAGANLNGADFSDSTLTLVEFAGADLSNADFSGATIQGATFAGATLNGAKLEGADFSGANLAGVVQPKLTSCPSSLPPNWHCVNNHLFGPGVDYSGVDFAATLFDFDAAAGGGFISLVGATFQGASNGEFRLLVEAASKP